MFFRSVHAAGSAVYHEVDGCDESNEDSVGHCGFRLAACQVRVPISIPGNEQLL